jgi:formate dehydrogenase iron-sulfur subunit
MRQAFLLDLTQCIGCTGCVVACNTGNELGADTNYIQIGDHERGTFPDVVAGIDNHRCYHCTDAACVKVCPTGALFQEDGLTRTNSDACIGCQYCVQACPYDVPKMVNGVSTKCDGCRDVTRAGGSPWCVQTCPSDALRYGPRDEIAAEAHRRASVMREKYPNAQVYGESQAGGLGMLVVLPDDPETMGIPADPVIPTVTEAWQDFAQPIGVGAIALTMAGAGVAAVIARRNQLQGAHEHETADTAAASAAADQDEERS